MKIFIRGSNAWKIAGKKKRNGFSLMELVATVVMIIVLSLISGPIYRSYTNNAKQAEGYVLLGTILSAQRAYFNDMNMFLECRYSSGRGNVTCNEEVLGIDARPNNHYTAFICGTNSQGGMDKGFASTVFGGVGVQSLIMVYNLTTGLTYR